MQINNIYKPIFTTDAKVVDLLGGRGRGGSHFMAQHALISLIKEPFFHGIFMRAIHSDIRTSLWKGFMFRLNEELENGVLNRNDFDISDNKMYVKYKPNGNTISSKGFKTSSGGQTAKLKSLEGATNIYIEEAEETTYEQHKKLSDSLRKGKMLIMRSWNIPTQEHYLVKKWYNVVPIVPIDGYGRKYEGWGKLEPKGIKRHLMIFGTYLDNIENIPEAKKEEWEQYRVDDPEHYFSDILGYTSGGAKGVIYKFNRHWKTYRDLPDIDFHVNYGLDFGGGKSNPKRMVTDNIKEFDEADGSSTTVFIRCHINKATKSVYVKLLCYKAFLPILKLNKLVQEETITTDVDGYDIKKAVIADNARTDLIREMITEGLNVVGAKTKEGGSNKVVSGIKIVQKYTIFFHEDDKPAIIDAQNYKWEEVAGGAFAGMITGNPRKLYENVMDAVRYAVVNYDLYNF